MAKTQIKTGDRVMVLSGVNKGLEGKVLRIHRDKNRATVEGDKIAKVSKHVRPNAANPDGGIIKQNPAIHLSNLMVIDPSTNEPSRMGKRRDKDGKLVRYFKKSEK